MSDLCEIKYPKSKKEHICCQCGIKIPKGVKYTYHYGTFDGAFYVNKMHMECNKKLIELNSDSSDYEWFNLDDFDGEDIFNFKDHQKNINKIYKL